MLLEELVACEVITRMLLGRIFRGHTCEGPPYLYVRVPEWHSGENIEGYTYIVFHEQHGSSRRGYSGVTLLTLRRSGLSFC